VLVVPTLAAWEPGQGDPAVLAWQAAGGGLVAVACSSPAQLDRALPGQPWVALPAAALHHALGARGRYRLLLDPTPAELAGAGGAPGRLDDHAGAAR
jgi:hypothetical protein